MKIGILTLTLHTNYGGILQAYALQTVLERMGHEVEVFNRPFIPQKTKWRDIPKRIIKKILGRDVVIFRERRYNREAPILNSAIWEFRKKYIHERIINSLHEIKETDYECIVVGSDQVWRPKYFKEQWHTGIEDAYLAFTKGWKIKRIAYAVSFGVDTWEYTQNETTRCRECIKMFDAISVREDSGISLLKQNLGVDAIQVLDPTLLLNKEDYVLLFEKAQTSISEGNLLVYILDYNKEKSIFVDKIANDYSLKPFMVNKSLVKQNTSIEVRILPPVESWLRGFFDAEMTITDSFHACVFSLIFNKKYIVVKNMSRGNSRIDNLLSICKKQGYHVRNSNINNFSFYICTHDSMCSILYNQIEKSFVFINNIVTSF